MLCKWMPMCNRQFTPSSQDWLLTAWRHCFFIPSVILSSLPNGRPRLTCSISTMISHRHFFILWPLFKCRGLLRSRTCIRITRALNHAARNNSLSNRLLHELDFSTDRQPFLNEFTFKCRMWEWAFAQTRFILGQKKTSSRKMNATTTLREVAGFFVLLMHSERCFSNWISLRELSDLLCGHMPARHKPEGTTWHVHAMCLDLPSRAMHGCLTDS